MNSVTIHVRDGWKDLDDIIGIIEDYKEALDREIEKADEEIEELKHRIEELETENEKQENLIKKLEENTNE